MNIRLNNEPLAERAINFYLPEDHPETSLPCLDAQLVCELGLRSDSVSTFNVVA